MKQKPILALATSLAIMLPCSGAYAFTPPDCAALNAWGRTAGPAASWNGALALPAPYSAETTQRVFGQTFGDWSSADIKTLDDALAVCRRDATTAKDTAAAASFAEIRKSVNAMGRTLRDAQSGRDSIAKSLAIIDAASATPQLLAGLSALATTSDTELKGFRTNLSEVSKIARSMAQLPAAEIDQVRAELKARSDKMGGSMADDRLAAVAATPESLDGRLAVRQLGFDARRDMGDAGTAVIEAAQARDAAIAAKLASAEPRPIELPNCKTLFDWAVTMDPNTSRAAKAGRIVVALEAPELATLFGKPFNAWDPADLTALGALAQQCRAAGRAGLLEGDARALDRAAARVVELHARAANQPPLFAALAASQTRADELIAATQAAPDGVDGLTALRRIGTSTTTLETPDAERVAKATAARRSTIIEATLGSVITRIQATPATFDGLSAASEAYFETVNGPLNAFLTDAERQQVRSTAQSHIEANASAALPGFKTKLASIPVTSAGLDELKNLEQRTITSDRPVWAPYKTALSERRDAIVGALIDAQMPAFERELAALPETRAGLTQALMLKIGHEQQARSESPAHLKLAERATIRAEKLRSTLADARCAPTLKAAKLSTKDGAQPVLIGTEVQPLARLVCALGEEAEDPPRYTSPGLFGSDHRLDFVGPLEVLLKLTLHEAEVRPKVKALVGKRLEDPNGARDMSVAEWQAFATEGTVLGSRPGCDRMAQHLGETGSRDGRVDSSDWQGVLECLIRFPEMPLPSAAQA